MNTDRALRTEEKMLGTPPDNSSPTKKKNDLYKALRNSIKGERKEKHRGGRVRYKPYDAIKHVKIPKAQHMRTMKKLFGLMVRGVDGRL